MQYLRLAALLAALLAPKAAQAAPPLCPHVLEWNSSIQNWANGAPWIKVIFSGQIATAQACGAQVFYRPYDTSIGTDDGDLPTNVTGTQYADAVWAKVSGLAVKPQAIGYRNEFPWYGTAANRHTSAQFRSYRDRLRALGYSGIVVYGSYGVGWPDSAVWDEPEVADAASCADAIETHEYFDFDVNCMSPWLTFRHRDIAIGQHPALLGSKPWFIGEFGSDRVCNPSVECDDALCRSGWLDNNKLSESAYVTQMTAYRAGCHPNVLAVFVFQQGAAGWANFETINSVAVSAYMKSTWTSPTTGTISGWVRTTGGTGISGATVSTNTGGYTATTDSNGDYTLSNVNAGTYSVTASKYGYAPSSAAVTVTAGSTSVANYTLTELDLTPPTIANITPTPAWAVPNGTITMAADVTDNKAIAMSSIALVRPTNLVVNPSFESGLAGWTNEGSPPYSTDNNYPAPTAKDGAHWAGTSCGYGSGVKNSELRQVVNVSPLTKYFLSVWVNTDGSPNPCSAFLQWKNGAATGDGQCTTLVSATNNTIGWKRLYALVTPTGSQLTIALKLSWDCGGMGGGGNFDLAEVRPALSPSTYSGGTATWNGVAIPATCEFLIYARDTSLNASLAVSPTITVAETPLTISQAKGYTDGYAVQLTNKVLTASMGALSWVQEGDRSSGIRINTGTSAPLGSRMTVAGRLLTVDGERSLDEAVAVQTGSPMPADPLYLGNGILGGANLNLYTPGITGGLGANNIGLLVTTFGRVTFAGYGFFYLDDGSKLDDGSGHRGLRVSATGLTFPSEGFVKVTGISSCEKNAQGKVVPLLRVRKQEDIGEIVGG